VDVVSGEEKHTRLDKSAVELVLADLEKVLHQQLNEILHHPDFQKLESGWRGLKFLVDRTDFRRHVLLDVLPAHKSDLRELFRDAVPKLARGMELEAPLSMVLLDYEFDATEEDIDLLGAIGELGGVLHFVSVGAAGASFFEVDTVAEIANLPPLWQHLGQPQYVRWNGFRHTSSSAFIALALPRFLLRCAYGSDSPVKGFPFQETIGDQSHCLWGRSSVAVVTAAIRSYVASGWPTRFAGIEQSIDDLPVFASGSVRMPLEVLLGEEKVAELGTSGFIVLSGRANSDRIFCQSVPTTHEPEEYDDPSLTEEAHIHVSLDCRLAAVRVAHAVQSLKRSLRRGHSGPSIKEDIQQGLLSWIRSTGIDVPAQYVSVKVVKGRGGTEGPFEELKVRLSEEILGQEIGIVLVQELGG